MKDIRKLKNLVIAHLQSLFQWKIELPNEVQKQGTIAYNIKNCVQKDVYQKDAKKALSCNARVAYIHPLIYEDFHFILCNNECL